jgi:hypothetical protein
MRVLKGVVPLALALGLGAAPLHAQGPEFSVGGGLDLPLGNFDDAANTGYHGLAAVSFVPTGSPVGFQVDGDYGRFGDDTPADVNFQLIYGTANVVYKFKTSETSTFRPYLIGGGGVYSFKPTGNDVLPGTSSETKFGINAGAGFDIKAGSAALFLEGRFHDVFISGSDLQYLPLTVGIRFGGH